MSCVVDKLDTLLRVTVTPLADGIAVSFNDITDLRYALIEMEVSKEEAERVPPPAVLMNGGFAGGKPLATAALNADRDGEVTTVTVHSGKLAGERCVLLDRFLK